MKTRMTISVAPETAAEIRREADRDGVDVSTWLARTAHREAVRRAYSHAADERRRGGLDTDERLHNHATRRAAVRRAAAGQ
ncbi:MAG: hypothetical protein ACR2FQ_05155 [Pseudonocardiaceae bacterium]